MPQLEVEGTQLETVEQGVGDPLVFVHGDLSDHRTWSAQVAALAADYRVIAYSRRYHFPNAEIDAGAANPLGRHVADLAALLGTLGAAPAHLIGDSLGAFICLVLAIEKPRLVRSLALAEPPVIPLLNVSTPPRFPEVARLVVRRPGAATAFLRFGATAIGPATRAFRNGDLETGMRTFARAVLGARAFHRLPEARIEQARQNVKPLAAALLGEGFPPLARPSVRQLSVPTLLLTGAHSPRLFRLLAEDLTQLIPGSRKITVPDASHVMHEQNPSFYNRAILRFLAELESRPNRIGDPNPIGEDG